MSQQQQYEIPETNEGKVEYARKLKDEGNELFKQGNYKKAIQKYKYVFLYVTGLNSNLMSVMSNNMSGNASSSEEKKELSEVDQLQLTANLNISQCYLKLENHERALEFAQKALNFDPNNLKGRLRRGLSYLALKDIDRAQEDLDFCSKQIPNDPLVKQGYKKLDLLKQDYKQKEKKMMKGIFGNYSNE
ncbi:hypothetical protein ABK040_003163 [Willaertia magna]